MKVPSASWVDHPQNPLIKPPFPEWMIADPTVLLPEDAPDGKWHLFAHGLIGLYHYHSYDGIIWKKIDGFLSTLAIRPFIFVNSKKFYLLYEKINPPYRLPYYNSHIEVISSLDLVHWEKPTILLKPKLAWHKTKNKIGNLGNPSLVKSGAGFRLYYSSGLTPFPDTFFCEPCFQGLATAKKITGPYRFIKKPIAKKLKSSQNFKSSNRVGRIKSGFYGLQTLIKTNPLSLLSSATLHYSFSQDGLKWTTDKKPIITPDADWKKTHVYVGSFIKKFNGQWRIYYNARDHRGLFGRETIGLSIAKD